MIPASCSWSVLLDEATDGADLDEVRVNARAEKPLSR
jgi:hypothetical protein